MAANAGEAIFRAIADFANLRREAKRSADALKETRSAAHDTDTELGNVEKQSNDTSKSLRGVGDSSKAADKDVKSLLGSVRELSKIKVKTTLDVDAARAKTEIRQLKTDLAGFRVTKLQIDADAARARAELHAVEGELSQLRTQPTSAEVDANIIRAEAKIERLKATIAGLRDAKLNVDADTASARAKLAAVSRDADQVDRKRPKIKVDVDTSKLKTLGTIVGVVAGAAALIGPVIGAVAALAGGLLSVASAAAPAIAGLAGVLAMAGALAQGVGVAAIALSGVGKALKALQTRQSGGGGGSSAASTAKAAQASADRIAAAQRTVERAIEQRNRTAITGDQQVKAAERSLADAISAAAQQVASAERSYTDAVKAADAAQADLNRTRDEARQRLIDLQDAVNGGMLDEEAATIRTKRAREELIRVQRAGGSGLDLQEAQLAVKQADEALIEVQHRNAQLATQAEQAAKTGIEGDQAVIDAHARVADATQNVGDAEAALTQARKDAARSIEDAQIQLSQTIQQTDWANADAQRAVTDASRELAQAYRDAGAAADAAGGGAADAFDKASPAAQRFALFLNNEVVPALHRIRDAIQERALPKFETAIRTLLPLTDLFASKLGDTADRLGDVAIKGANMVSSGPWTRDFATILDSNNRMITTAGDAALNWADGLRNVWVTALPLAERLTNLILKGSETAKAFLEAKRTSGEMGAFFDKAGNVIEQLLRILGNLFVSLWNIGKAAEPAGQILLNSFEAATRKLREFTGSVDGQTKLHDYFMSIVPAVKELGRLFNDLVLSIVRIGQNEDLAPLIAKIRTELLPAIENLITKLQSGVGPQLVALATHLADIITALGGGALVGFLAVLNGIATALAWILSIPGLGPVIGFVLTLAGAAAALGLVAGWFGAIGAALTLLVPLLEAAAFLFLALLSPVGLVILAIAAVAFAIYEIITHWDTVKQWIGAFFGWIWDGAQALWGWLGGLFGAPDLGAAIYAGFELVKGALGAAMDWCKDKVSGAWDAVTQKSQEFSDGLDAKTRDLGEKIKSTFWDAFETTKRTVGDAWDIITGNTNDKANAIRDILGMVDGVLGTDFAGAWDRAGQKVADIWGGIQRTIDGVVSWIQRQIDRLNTAIDSLRAKASAAISSVTSYIPGFATGGMVGGSGDGDNQIIRATAGEWVVPKDATARFLPFLKAITFGSLRATAQIIDPAQTRLLQDSAIGLPDISQLAGLREMLTGAGTGPASLGNTDQSSKTITNVTNVYNPVAEPASDSVGRRMRSLQLMGAFS